MKINVGAGYRAYYVLRDGALILLLCGGNKRTQSRDIEKAIAINNAITDEDIGALP
jgi:putative addiction module killer protein